MRVTDTVNDLINTGGVYEISRVQKDKRRLKKRQEAFKKERGVYFNNCNMVT